MKIKLYITLLLVTFMACKKPYNLPVVATNSNYLVVEGVINSGADSTFIKLSRTVNVSSKTTLSPELHAQLAVQGDQNTSYPLTETKNGTYVAVGLNLDATHKYRLAITTSAGKQYQSDYVAVVNSPAIDSVSYVVKPDGVDIFSNTHDPKNNTRYYRWDYQETWIIHSNFTSYFKSNGDTVLGRDLFNDEVNICWQSDTSSTIIIGSSARLSSDVIVNNPIISIPSTSEKFSSRYSIQVRQYALSGDAFNFWQNLKKTTEDLGSIFDPEPSHLNGNIHSVNNPTEPVIGYISVGSTSCQRIFIDNRQLPAWVATKAYPDCLLDTLLYKYLAKGSIIPVNQIDLYINYHKFVGSALIPVDAISVPGSPPLGYSASDAKCVDCTLRGTNKQPAFWK